MAMRAQDLAVYTTALRDGTLLSEAMRAEMFTCSSHRLPFALCVFVDHAKPKPQSLKGAAGWTDNPPESDVIGDDGSGAGKRSSLKESGTQYCHGISRSLESGAGLGPSYGHGGGTLGFSSRMLWLEEADCVLAVMTNVGGASPASPDLSAALQLAVRELYS